MKQTLLLAFALLSLSAFSDVKDSTVKVVSHLCGSSERLESSGLPVRFRGENYILTSHWGVLEESESVCHEVLNGDRNIAATLSYMDWAAGFALLKPASEIVPVFDFDKDIVVKPASSERHIFGFTKNATVLVEKKARVIGNASTRHHFPSLLWVQELVGEKLPSGFVGAPVYATGLQGIVSGQWIEIIPGSKARVNEWKSNGFEERAQWILLPLSLIQERLKAARIVRQTYQATASKLSDRSEFFTKGLFWKLNCPEDAGQPPKDGIGPIGGGDGVGIGGNMKGTETCSVEVSPQSTVELVDTSFFPKTTYADILAFASAHGKFNVPFLYGRDAGDKLARLPFLTLPQFFWETSEGSPEKRLPVMVVPTPPKEETGDPYEKMRAGAISLRSFLIDTYPLISKREDERKNYRAIYALSLLVDSYSWKSVRWLDFSFHDITQSDFAKNIEYKGQPLQKVIEKKVNELEWLHRSAGGH